MRRTRATLMVAAAVSIGLIGCGSDDDAETPEGTIDVTLRDFEIELSDTSTPSGTVTFSFDNKGPSVHEFVVFKTDLAPDALPTDAGGDVAESDTFAPVDELEDIGLGADQELAVDLEAGTYVVVCNIPGHYRQGMRAALTVS